jgi:hypothetical protein
MTKFPHVYDLQTKTIAPRYCIIQHLIRTLATWCAYWINVFYYNNDPLKHHFRFSNWNITLEDPQHLTHKVLFPKKHVFVNIVMKMIVYFSHNDLNANEREFSCKSVFFLLNHSYHYKIWWKTMLHGTMPTTSSSYMHIMWSPHTLQTLWTIMLANVMSLRWEGGTWS